MLSGREGYVAPTSLVEIKAFFHFITKITRQKSKILNTKIVLIKLMNMSSLKRWNSWWTKQLRVRVKVKSELVAWPTCYTATKVKLRESTAAYITTATLLIPGQSVSCTPVAPVTTGIWVTWHWNVDWLIEKLQLKLPFSSFLHKWHKGSNQPVSSCDSHKFVSATETKLLNSYLCIEGVK